MREDNIRMVFDHFKHGAEADHLKYDDVVEIFGGEAQAQEIMQFLDSDKDGVISFEDFRKAVEESMAEDLDDEECWWGIFLQLKYNLIILHAMW